MEFKKIVVETSISPNEFLVNRIKGGKRKALMLKKIRAKMKNSLQMVPD